MKISEINRNDLSPMMQQYYDIKSKYMNDLIFYRLGDFYELFFEDASIASHELELTLTGKNAGLKERIPMCGVPHHSAKSYIERLVNKGYKVVVVEQMEDPKTTKGMVKREVVEVITKGTLIDLEFLNEYDFNYIGGILDNFNHYLLTYIDLSTGEVKSLMLERNDNELINEILHLNIKELIVQDTFNLDLINTFKDTYSISVYTSNELLDDYKYVYEDIKDEKICDGIKHLLYYLRVCELKELSHLKPAEIVKRDNYLQMDIHTIRNLELIETLRLKERKYSLIWMLDKCKTAMGSRMLKNFLINPLKDKEKIEERYNYIESLNKNFLERETLAHDLYEVYDLERLCGKISCGSLNARDVLQIKRSLSVLPNINNIIKSLGYDLKINELRNLYDLLEESIYEDPPVSLKEGYLIKSGYNAELDELKSIRSGGKEFISSIEEKERKRTGIQNLKVGFNKVFGYYIEITKGQLQNIPEDSGWERRQTLTGAERFISPELKEKEALVLNAEERIIELEYNLFVEIRNILKKHIFEIEEVASTLAFLDVMVSLSIASDEYHFIRPTLKDNNIINIKEGYHPVVKEVNGNTYVNNDIHMNDSINTLLITGPNMSGKSTYMRQLAITVIMAQMGSFVPCEICELPIFDKIFTRIGASDDLVSGESTFMVEMLEAKNAITNATSNSLILFDELGRGTATFDGMSLARAILEYVTDNIKCKTLFSTHYHELTDLDKKFKTIKNVHVEAKEVDGKITFLHKVRDGATDKSYGIHVARLAGMPEDLLIRANEILNHYEEQARGNKKKRVGEQMSFTFDQPLQNDKLTEEVEKIDPLNTTPMEALNIIYNLKEILKNKK